MILVDNQPILSLPKDDKRRDWYEIEIAKIQKKKEPIVIKKISSYRLNAKGVRVKPPRIGVQSFKERSFEGRGMEIWACCRSYKKREDNSLEFDPNFYYFETQHTLDPKKDSELIFYFTCIIDLERIGFAIDNPEAEAQELNEKEIAELDVRYAIQRRLEDINELRFVAKSWGISHADSLTEAVLRRLLFDTVKKSEENKDSTKKGYKEFMDEVFNTSSEVTEARAFVSMALAKSILAVNKTTRRATYVPTGDVLCIVPLEHANRINDYLADYFLRKNKELLETIKQDVTGELPEFKISVADVENLKDRESLKKTAEKLMIKVLPQMKDETIRKHILEKIE